MRLLSRYGDSYFEKQRPLPVSEYWSKTQGKKFQNPVWV
jgi:hypothetical protein